MHCLELRSPIGTCILNIMSAHNKTLLEFHPTTIEDVRKEYGLEKPGSMDQTIDILHEWIQKQEHFVKKDFCREYLERVIISTKGSLERAKVRVDKLCTLRTVAPELFEKINVKQDLQHLRQSFVDVYMPKLTEDHYRPFIIQLKSNITSSSFFDGYRHSMIFGEYIRKNDYANGVIAILDLRDTNILDLVKVINFVDLNKAAFMYMEGYGFRLKNIFLVSSSKAIDLVSNLLRRVLSAKIGQRITVVESVESLHDHVRKELLPEDLGGQQRPLIELYDKWTEELSSEEHVAYVREMTRACTNEELRRSDGLADEYLGIPGSFKFLTVD